MSNGGKRELRDEDGSAIRIVYCNAMKCQHHMGKGQCEIVHTMNGDDKISVNSEGVCENYSPI